MLNLPASAAFERRIPKQKFYANLTVTPELRRCFTEQIESITWADKLAPQTMNLAAGKLKYSASGWQATRWTAR